MLLDIDLPDGSGLDALREIKSRQPEAVVIMITGNVLIQNTISALRGGAYDFIGKPLNLEELRVTIRNGIEASQLRREVTEVRRERARQFSFDQIIGESAVVRRMLSLARKVAESRSLTRALAGRVGHGQRPRGEGHPLRLAPRRRALRRHQLRGHPFDAHRVRAVRLREGCVHRREGAQGRVIRAGRGRHALPRRDRRVGAWSSGETFARARRGRFPSRRRLEGYPARRARRRGLEPRPQGGGRGGALPHRSLLPPVRHPDRHPALARARRRHAPARRALRPTLRRAPAAQEEDTGPRARGAGDISSITPGPATSASCATSSNARSSSKTATSSRPSTCRAT